MPGARKSRLAGVGGLAALALLFGLGWLSLAARSRPIWPFPFRLGLDSLDDPAVLQEIHFGLVVAVLGLSLAALGVLLPMTAPRLRVSRWPMMLAGAVALLLALPRFGGLVLPAVPASFLVSPTGYSARAVARGREVFAQYCAECHGSEAEGDGPAIGRLTKPPANLTDDHILVHREGDLFWRIGIGFAGLMPAFAGVVDGAARWQAIDFLRANADGFRLRRLRGTVGDYGVRTPDFAVRCPDGSAGSIGGLRGRPLHIVIANATTAGRLRELASASDIGTTVIAVALDRSPAAGVCLADDLETVSALALYRSVPVGRTAGTEFLIDPDGLLRAIWYPGASARWADWRDTGVLKEQIASLRRPATVRRLYLGGPHIH